VAGESLRELGRTHSSPRLPETEAQEAGAEE